MVIIQYLEQLQRKYICQLGRSPDLVVLGSIPAPDTGWILCCKNCIGVWPKISKKEAWDSPFLKKNWSSILFLIFFTWCSASSLAKFFFFFPFFLFLFPIFILAFVFGLSDESVSRLSVFTFNISSNSASESASSSSSSSSAKEMKDSRSTQPVERRD